MLTPIEWLTSVNFWYLISKRSILTLDCLRWDVRSKNFGKMSKIVSFSFPKITFFEKKVRITKFRKNRFSVFGAEPSSGRAQLRKQKNSEIFCHRKNTRMRLNYRTNKLDRWQRAEKYSSWKNETAFWAFAAARERIKCVFWSATFLARAWAGELEWKNNRRKKLIK